MASRLKSMSSFDKIRGELNCAICLDPYTDPKILPCFHTFCEKCLENTTRCSKGALLCPTCRTKSGVYLETEVGKLPNNYLACRVLDQLDQEERSFVCKCTNCEDNNAASWTCLTCKSYLCEVCHEAHSRMFRNTHVVKNIDDDDDDFLPVFQSLEFTDTSLEKEVCEEPLIFSCAQHVNKECELYCKDCKECMCTVCFAIDHRNHEMQAISQVAAEQKEEIRQLLLMTQTKTTRIEDALETLTVMSTKIEERHNDLILSVNATVAEITEIAQRKAKELCLQLDDAAAQRFKVIGAQKLHLELEKLKLEGACFFADEVLTCDNPSQVVQWNDQLLDRMTELNNCLEFEEFGVEVNDFIDCHFDITDVKHCINKAFVSSSNTTPHTTTLDIKSGPAIDRQEVEFVVMTNDKVGNQRHNALDDVKLKIVNPNGEVVDIDSLADGNDGTYFATFEPQQPGDHHVFVTIRGEEAWETPVSVYVSKDFMTIHHATHGFGTKGSGEGEFLGPLFAAVNDEGNLIVVADSQNHCMQLFNAKGKFLKKFGQEGKGIGELYPRAAAFSKDGSLVVLDSQNSRVQIFSPEGQVLQSFPQEGNRKRELLSPTGISVDNRSRIIVSDTGNNCVKVFSPSGEFLFEFGKEDPEKLRNPQSAIYAKDQFVVADTGNNSIKLFSLEGVLIKTVTLINGVPLNGPFHISADANGFLFVCETGRHSIKVLNPHGNLVTVFGAKGREEGYLMYPSSAVVTQSGQVVVADWGNDRIQIFH